jgi:hypothetical protein
MLRRGRIVDDAAVTASTVVRTVDAAIIGGPQLFPFRAGVE